MLGDFYRKVRIQLREGRSIIMSKRHALEDLLREDVCEIHGYSAEELCSISLNALSVLYNRIFEPIEEGTLFEVKDIIDHDAPPWAS